MSSSLRSSDPRLIADAFEAGSAQTLAAALDELLEPVLSSRRTAEALARAIATLARAEQDFVLHWISVIARTNGELAYQFAYAAPEALEKLDLATAETWIVEAMDVYDREGLHRGSEVLRHAGDFADATRRGSAAVSFNDIAHILQLFVHGLSGRRVRLDIAPRAYTDTDTLYFPARIAHGDTLAENFLVYKATAALLWAQSRYGTFTVDLEAECRRFADPERALSILNVLETIRLEARIARELPGLEREMASLRGSASVDRRCLQLLEAHATIEDSVTLLGVVYDNPPQIHFPYMPVLQPREAAAAKRERLRREKAALQKALGRVIEADTPDAHPRDVARFELELNADTAAADSPRYELKLDGERIAPPEDVAELLDSILQDLDEIPDDYLVPNERSALEGDRDSRELHDAWRDLHHEEGAFFYNEWDYRRRHYRKNWCVLRELDVAPGDPDFVEATLTAYSGHVAQLKRMFESMRGEDRMLRRQSDGDAFDLDAVIEAYADMRHGAELTQQLFTKRRKAERDLAVMFMVDMSGSTKGWINEAERQALVMLCEALEVLGDRYAIYGFSGMTRKRCEVYRVKRFDEIYGAAVRSRIAGMLPQDYTRMGAAIRHLTMLLNTVEARTKLLITLSDGKPDDYSDNYRGDYGIEDTRQALIEAHRCGIKPFCITIDREARDYLPHMYGAVNWTVVDDIAHLPTKVAHIYRRLTRSARF